MSTKNECELESAPLDFSEHDNLIDRAVLDLRAAAKEGFHRTFIEGVRGLPKTNDGNFFA
jgi:hypothetical protein